MAQQVKIITRDGVPLAGDPALPVKGVSTEVDRISFVKTLANTVDPAWGTVVASGAGQTVNQTSGNLVLTSGTTANSETIIRGLRSYQGGVRVRARSTLSQRIANQSFFIELVDVVADNVPATIGSATVLNVTLTNHGYTAQNIGQSMYLGGYVGTGTFVPGRYAISAIPDANTITFTVAGMAAGLGTVCLFGHSYYHLIYDGTSATTAKFDTQRKGWASGDSSVTINTTATPGHLAIISGNDLQATLQDGTVATATGAQFTFRGSRIENVPDDVALRFQLRVVNGSTAPASTTTWTVGMVSVASHSSLDTVIQDLRPIAGQTPLPIIAMGGNILASNFGGAVTRADAEANSTTAIVGAAGSFYNGTTWDRARGMSTALTTGDTGAKTATGNGATITNVGNKGALIVVSLGTVTGTTPTAVFKVQGSVDSGTTWVDIPGATTATLTATGAYGILLYPGVGAVAGVATAGTSAAVSTALPRTWRVVWTIGGSSPSFTITAIQYMYLPN